MSESINWIAGPLPGVLILFALLIRLVVSDIKSRELPVRVLWIGTGIALGWDFFGKAFSWQNVAGGVAIGGILLVISLLTGEAIGRGDAWLFMISGLLLGFQRNMALLMLACLISGVWAVILLVRKKADRKVRIPFLPFVLAAECALLPGIVMSL